MDDATAFVISALTGHLTWLDDPDAHFTLDLDADMAGDVVAVALGLCASLIVELGELTGEPPLARVQEIALRQAARAD